MHDFYSSKDIDEDLPQAKIYYQKAIDTAKGHKTAAERIAEIDKMMSNRIYNSEE